MTTPQGPSDPYNTPDPNQPSYGQAQPQYGQPDYGQQPTTQFQYGQPEYGQYGAGGSVPPGTPPPTGFGTPPSGGEGKGKLIAALAAGAAAVVAIALVLVFVVFKGDDEEKGSTASPADAVKGFYNAVNEGDIDKAFTFVCAKDRKEFTSDRKENPDDYTQEDIKDLKIGETTKKGSVWNVEVTATIEGDTETETIPVVQEDGKYLVCFSRVTGDDVTSDRTDDRTDTSDLSDFSDFSDLSDFSDMSDLSDMSDYTDLYSDFSDMSDFSDLFSDLSDLTDMFSDLTDLYSFS